MGSSFFSAVRRSFSLFAKNHRPHVANSIFGEEHVFGAAQTDAFSAERARFFRVAGNIGVGAHSDLAERLRPAHKLLQFRMILRIGREQLSVCL